MRERKLRAVLEFRDHNGIHCDPPRSAEGFEHGLELQVGDIMLFGEDYWEVVQRTWLRSVLTNNLIVMLQPRGEPPDRHLKPAPLVDHGQPDRLRKEA
jgi:hypothetical protein